MIKHSEAVVFYGGLVSPNTVKKIEQYLEDTHGKKRAEILISMKNWELDYAIYYLSLKSRWQEYTKNMIDLTVVPLLHLLAVRCVREQKFNNYRDYNLSSSQRELVEDLLANIFGGSFATNGRSHIPYMPLVIEEEDNCIGSEAIEFLFRRASRYNVSMFSVAKNPFYSENNSQLTVSLSPAVKETFETMLWLNDLLYRR